MRDNLLFNIHFLTKNCGKLDCLYMYAKLRMYARKHGGYIEGYNFTHHEKYNILPKLKSLGWVKGKFIVNHRKICNREGVYFLFTELEESFLESKDAFRGFILGVAETYSLRRTISPSKFRRSPSPVIGSERESKFHQQKITGEYTGIVYNGSLRSILGLTERTISRWRKFSRNKYYLETYCVPKNFTRKAVYNASTGKWYLRELEIETRYKVFSIPLVKPLWLWKEQSYAAKL